MTPGLIIQENGNLYIQTFFGKKILLTSKTAPAYKLFLNTEYLQIYTFDIEQSNIIYTKLLKIYQSPIYFKMYEVGDRLLVLVTLKDTYQAFLDYNIKQIYSYPLSLCIAESKKLKSPVVYADESIFLYYEHGKTPEVYATHNEEEFKSFIFEKQKERYIYNISPNYEFEDMQKVILTNKEQNNLLSNIQQYEAFTQKVVIEKISLQRHVAFALVFLFLALLFRNFFFSYIPSISNLVPIQTYADTLKIPAIQDINLNTLEEFIYRKSSNYVIYKVALPDGREIIFPTLNDLTQYKDYYKGAKFYKLEYNNNQLISTTEITP